MSDVASWDASSHDWAEYVNQVTWYVAQHLVQHCFQLNRSKGQNTLLHVQLEEHLYEEPWQLRRGARPRLLRRSLATAVLECNS